MTLFEKVENAIAEIRPYLQNDGGDVELVQVKDQIAYIRWKGYCASCSKNPFTYNGISEIIKKNVPEITEVIEQE